MRHISTLAVLAMLCATGVSRADVLVRNDGHALAGKVVQQSDTSVKFEIDAAGHKTAQDFPRDSIRELVIDTAEQPTTVPSEKHEWKLDPEPAAPEVKPAAGPSYYVIPLHGEVGSTVLAAVLEKSLDDALKRHPSVVILDIDSPGGMVVEAQRIIDVLRKYTKQMRIVAYTDKSLSAAAVFTLSVKEIYAKPSSIVGAATAYQPRDWLPPILDEKMESVWRATARSSAQSGGHEPLLAEAMIDNDLELHLETVDGIKVVKPGPGEETLCRKGKILTLTAAEAVNCGLANGVADDYAALGKALGFQGWTESPGLGRLLAEYWPKRQQVFETEMKKIGLRLDRNLTEAKRLAPTGILWESRANERTSNPAQSQDEWNQRSIFCALALKKAEQNLKEAVVVSDQFPEYAALSSIYKDAMLAVGELRQSVYDSRDNFVMVSAPSNRVAVRTGPRPIGSPPSNPANTSRPFPTMLTSRSPAEALKFGTIAGEWTDATKSKLKENENLVTELLFAGDDAKRTDEGLELTAKGDSSGVMTPTIYQPPLTIEAIAQTDNTNIRLYFARGMLIFNWEMNKEDLRFADLRTGSGPDFPGYGLVPTGQWQTITWQIDKDMLRVLVNGEECFTAKGNYANVQSRVGIGTAWGSTLKLKSLKVTQGVAQPATPYPKRTPHITQPAQNQIVFHERGGKLPEGARKSEMIGGNGGMPYIAANANQLPLLGVRYKMGSWAGQPCIGKLEPIWERPADANRANDPTLVLAKDGYIVGGMIANGDKTNLIAARLLFMRWKNGKIDPNDKYESDWIGTPKGETRTMLGGTGEPIIGLFGRQGMNLDAVGVVIGSSAPAKE